MDLAQAIYHVNTFFQYEPEASRVERWRILSPADPKGDCEDYSLTVVHAASGGLFGLLVALLWRYRLWAVTDPNGRPHMICVTSGGMAFDNHRRQLTAVSDYKARGYKFRYFWPFPLIWMKLLIGKF